MSSRGLRAYRDVLRAAKVAFNGDVKVLTAAREEIQRGFRNPDLSLTEEERLSHVEGVSKFLLSNIVQASKEPEGAKYRLNIHEHTELGDNDTVFKNKGKQTLGGGNGQFAGCCGGSGRK
ncbi:hypothetical protein WICPIJ_005458 [Wickerhamomyces pijperi]|uniref:Mitochondrial zinc maintenance protein 1, mitochondrial n=1 Tax=Wickerhamomyces pijperi TaxID=599730 RepID=A0A9P8Q5P7_WICPI|nr:hypothetical protein WICPIJ_005458 [Wickerhamomyces pijperi]